MFYWQTIGTAPWHAEQVAGPGTTSFTGPSIAQVGDSSVIAASGTDDSVMFYWQTIGTAACAPKRWSGPVTAPEISRRSHRSGIRR